MKTFVVDKYKFQLWNYIKFITSIIKRYAFSKYFSYSLVHHALLFALVWLFSAQRQPNKFFSSILEYWTSIELSFCAICAELHYGSYILKVFDKEQTKERERERVSEWTREIKVKKEDWVSGSNGNSNGNGKRWTQTRKLIKWKLNFGLCAVWELKVFCSSVSFVIGLKACKQTHNIQYVYMSIIIIKIDLQRQHTHWMRCNKLLPKHT